MGPPILESISTFVEYHSFEDTTDRSKPQTCKYCGLRFVQKDLH